MHTRLQFYELTLNDFRVTVHIKPGLLMIIILKVLLLQCCRVLFNQAISISKFLSGV